MFELGEAIEDATAIGTASAEALLAQVKPLIITQRRLHARTILAAFRVGELAYSQALELQLTERGMVNGLPDKIAVREVANQFAIPRPQATRWLTLVNQLLLLRKITVAFLDGTITESQAAVIAAILVTIEDPKIRAKAEDLALELVEEGGSNHVLGERVEAVAIALDPNQAARTRELHDHLHDVRFRRQPHGQYSISATVPLEDGLVLKQKVTAMIWHNLCHQDPRSAGQQRVAALRAIINGHDRITCQCPHETTCPAPANKAAAQGVSSETTPNTCDATGRGGGGGVLVQLHTDHVVLRSAELVPTEPSDGEPALRKVTGTSLVPYVTGYGPVDPELARALAYRGDAAWQEITERPPDSSGFTAGPHRSPGPAVPTAEFFGDGPIVIRSRPPNPVPIDPSGHGGLTTPPPGALKYQPSAPLIRQLRFTDLHCRAPGCSRPAEACQYDHVVPFNHADPAAGGWTIADNLIPLCVTDHQTKTFGDWQPVLHTGRIVVWTHRVTGAQITTYPDRY